MKCILEKIGDDYYLFSDKYATSGDKCIDARSSKLIIATGKQPTKKILLSTNKDVDSFIDVSKVYDLLGIVIVNELFNKWALDNTDSTMETNSALNKGFKGGYNKCLEDNVDKRFTLEDMKKAVEFGKQEGVYEISEEVFPCPPSFTFESLIIEDKTSWKVEVKSNVCGFNYVNMNIPTPIEYKIKYRNNLITVIGN